MKITLSQLLPHLQQNLASIYLISGDEPLLVDSARETIRQHASLKGFTHREYLHLETGFNWSDFLLLAYSLSLFATQQIIELRLPNAKPGDTGSKALIEYAQQPPSDKILIIITPKLDSATQKSKWFKAIEQQGIFIQIWPLERAQLLNWIRNQAQQMGINLSSNGMKIIADYTAGNLLATQQELEKLSLLYYRQPNNSNAVPHGSTTPNAGSISVSISDEQIITALSDNAHFTIFDLIDACYLSNTKQVINIFQHLQDDGIEPILILWAITRELRLLINLKSVATNADLLNRQLNYNQGYKIKNENKMRIKQLLPKLPMSKLENMLCDAAAIDQMIKGVKVGDTWRELQRIAIYLTTHLNNSM